MQVRSHQFSQSTNPNIFLVSTVGNLSHFWLSVISLKQNGLTAGAASMDYISPLRNEMTASVPSVSGSWIWEGRGISAKICKFFLKIKLS